MYYYNKFNVYINKGFKGKEFEFIYILYLFILGNHMNTVLFSLRFLAFHLARL